VAIGLPTIKTAQASVDWPTVDGTIESSELKMEERMENQQQHTEYRAVIEYSYEVGGKRFRTNNVAFGALSSSSRSAIQEIVDRYPVGKRVTVHYDPQSAENAVLEPGASADAYMAFAAGVLFVGLGLALIWMALRMFKLAGQGA
jgi:hypothetical protein